MKGKIEPEILNVQISSEELAAGMYLLKLVKGGETLGTGKLLVR